MFKASCSCAYRSDALSAAESALHFWAPAAAGLLNFAPVDGMASEDGFAEGAGLLLAVAAGPVLGMVLVLGPVLGVVGGLGFALGTRGPGDELELGMMGPGDELELGMMGPGDELADGAATGLGDRDSKRSIRTSP